MFYKWSVLFVICALPTFGRDYRQEKNDLVRLEEEKVISFKLSLQKKLQELITIRNSLMAGEQKLLRSVSSNLVGMGSTENVTKGCIVHVEGRDVVFVVTSDNFLSILKNTTLEHIRGFPTSKVFHSLQGVGNGVTAWLIAQHTGKKGRHFVGVYAFESMTLKRTQRLDFDGFGLVAATKFNDRLYVAIISESDVLTDFRLYQWVGTQFDEIFWDQMDTVYSSLAVWNIDGSVYVGMSSADTERLGIQQFIEHSGEMSNIQSLDVHAQVIKVFKDAGSHHYLVCATQSSVMIYWWTGSAFQLMQSTDAFPQNIVDIAIHNISDSVVIAVAFQHEVLFLVQDSSSWYVKAGSQRFDPSKSLKSVLLWENGYNLNMLPIFEGNHSISIYKIDHEFEVSEAEKESTLEGCLTKLGNYLNKREEKIIEINHIVENTWSRSTSRRSSSFKVNGTIKSLSNSTILALNLDTNFSSSLSLQEKNIELIDCAQVLHTKVRNSVLKSAEQHIQSNLSFTNLAVRHGEVNKLFSDVNINGVGANRLPYALKKYGQQIFPYETDVRKVVCKTVTTDILNENKIEDYVLLNSGLCRLTGYMTFENVSARKVIVRYTINGVNVDKIVLTSKVQNILGPKSFKNLSADSIHTTKRNIILDRIKEDVYLDSKNFDSFRVDIPTLNIEGNLNVSLLNGNEISHLYSKSVKKNELGDIDGFKTMKSVVIKGNVTILEGINNVNFGNLMTVKTDQNISGDITFSSIAHLEDILTDSLNGVDLSSEAVVKAESSSNIEIEGVKTFQKNLNVSGIVLEEEVLIDSFDPSVEISEIMHKVDNANVTITHWFKNNVTIGGGIANDVEVSKNNFAFLKDLENVWLKTIEQNISSLDINTAAVIGSLQVSSVNGVSVEDLVTINGNSSINATINFTKVVSTQILNLEKKANLTYSSGFWNPDILLKISGNITTENAMIEGDLNITGAIENITDITDLMQAEKNQTVEGKVEFKKIDLTELNSTDLNIDILKLELQNISISEYYERSVLLSKDIRIFNKTFATLNGTEMQCDGTLNSVSLDKVVTTDTEQKLQSSYEFQNSTYFNKNATVTVFFGGIQLEKVIYTDSNRSISNKYFNGSVTTSHLATTGNVSGVNITRLHLEALNKTVDNNVTEKMTFHGNLSAKEMQVTGNKRIDDIDLKSLIKLNESVSLEDCNASSVTAENVTVKGNISGCNLNSLYENALLLTQDAPNITSKVHVDTLEIHGNLKIEFLNGANIEEWMLLLVSLENSEMGTNLTFENLKTDNINILKTVNNMDLNFLLNDYVQKNHPQEILGKKRFQDIDVNKVTIDVLNSSKICENDFLEIYKLAINGSTEDEILLLSNLKVASLEGKNFTVAGKLNYLKLPNDVVLSDTSEIIENEIQMDSFKASQGLNVSGKIDNVPLNEFLEERATLDAYEIISSTLIFEDNASIAENLSVSGTINEIRLKDVVKVFQNEAVSGTKIFTEEFEGVSDVIVNGFVNDIRHLDHLQKSLYKDSRNESVKDVVKFSSLSTSSLTCDTINGHNIADFFNHTRIWGRDVEDKLHNFTSDINSHQELLSKQGESLEYPLSLYSSFELHKILNFSLVERFLPVYEYGTYGPKYDLQVTHMIMWVKQVGDPCRKIKSLIADVMSDGTFNLTNEMEGKIFPFSLSVAKENVVGFYVQVEHAKKCSVRKKPHIVVKTIYSSGEMEKKIIVSPIVATILDVQLLDVSEDEIYLIISYSNAGSSERIFVYHYDDADHTWSISQTFHFKDLMSVSILSLEPHTHSLFEIPSVYLLVTGDDSSPGVTVYDWDFDLQEFTSKINLSASVSSHALWVENDGALYLLLAKGMSRIWKDNAWMKSFTEPLEVYTVEENELILNHTVNVKGVSSLEAFSLADETFVLATSNHKGTVYVLQYRGFNGFELIQEIHSPGVTEARVFTVDKHLYLALNSKTGPSRILKTSIRGGREGLE